MNLVTRPMVGLNTPSLKAAQPRCYQSEAAFSCSSQPDVQFGGPDPITDGFNKAKKRLKQAGAVLLVALAAAGGYLLINRSADKPAENQPVQTQPDNTKAPEKK